MNISRLAFVIITIFILKSSSAQNKDSLSIKNGIDKSNMVSTHHFGLFSARINHNFKVRPPKKSTTQLTVQSGNIFHPALEVFLPKDPTIREQFSNLTWFKRPFTFIDQETTPADLINIEIDAVYKVFRLEHIIPLSENHEIGLGLRTFMPTKGTYPFSFVTSDKTIEWFHSNIAGGEDPFGRKFFGLNEVNINYEDRNGRTMQLSNNQFIFSGIEINHFYYPEYLGNKSKNLHFNFGSHLGINTSKYNPSIDVGISGNGIKKWIYNDRNEIRLGIGLSALRKNFINFRDPVDFGNNKYIASGEAVLEYTMYTDKKNYNTISLFYQLQTPYNTRKEKDFFHLKGFWQEINAGWHNGYTKTLENITTWSLMYTYGTKKIAFSVYIKQDTKVNNAPDIETGISLKINTVK
ncbi:hypothetical protein [Leptobacterium sp. I13]|uniref:hypothetical protein n=1 Tax=Leptobacterium meishanense TaxID=3128904 RepID=UPI0030ED02C8